MTEDYGKVLEWSVWASLDKHKDAELVLLKGHLILEVFIDNFLKNNTSENINKLSFYGKVKKLEKICSTVGFESRLVEYLFELNAIRNKFAHEWQFSTKSSGMDIWAKNVLSRVSATKYTRFTPRTKIVHSFSALASELIELEKRL